MKSGIYFIKNLITNQYYIGSSSNISKRFRDHKWYLRKNIHHNSYLQNSWNKYGEDKFEFMVIQHCEMKNILEVEKELIKKYNSHIENGGFNVNDPEHVFLGRKHSLETKKKLSAQKIGVKNPNYGKIGHNTGKIMSDEQKNKNL
ncbi:MAG: GIY-YIG nuclease family protein [Richelia sp. RM2_1_2]|nr:GIY-YIG nuclease family protein [Richelia sp. RM2_1_2]